MTKNNVLEFAGRDTISDPLTSLLRSGARRLINQAVEAELQDLLIQYSGQRTDDGHAVVVRSGYLPERELQTGLGPVTVKIPKVRSKTGEPVTFQSALVPPYVRKTKSLEAALPWLFLKGISSGEMGEALKVLIGPEAKGLSASTVSRLKQTWGQEYQSWRDDPLDKDRWVYMWADGIYSGLRGEQMKLCALVVIGVNERGEKHFLAIEDGIRESTQSWREVLLKLKARGMNGPELAIGDGAMGFWSALEEVYPETRQQRCWMHKTMNVLNCLPKSAQAKAKGSLHDIWQAETKANAEKAFNLFIKMYEPKYPKAAICLQKDRDELMAFFDFPAQHWQSIRTSNPIESTFGTIRHRTRRSKGCLSRDGMLHMMFKLGQC
ncbi:MAG TPA: IS256 family transposase, partial [Rhodospirillales bacterium]|nr:IS256 family transposase [Rhodospirillales bacterium]